MNTARILTLALCLALPTAVWAGPPNHDGPPPNAQELLERIQEAYPDKYEHLMKLRRSHPAKFHAQVRQILQRLGPDPEKWEDMREQHKDMRTKHDAFRDLVADYAEAKPKEQAAIQVELVELAGELFELRQEQRRQKLERVKEQIAELEEEITERDKSRDEIIQEFVEDAIGDRPKGL